MLIAAFLIPLIVMASWFALSQTNPKRMTIPVLNNVMRLTPVWHNLPTAYRNQHRLVIAGLPIAVFLALAVMMINPDRRKTITVFILGSTLITALAANGLDCLWLFRTRPEWIGPQTVIRSIPWFVLGAVVWWSTRIKYKAEP
ncbi:MAG: hypothetical protein ABIH24_01370 [Verrucomicrobiota bacterium]